MTLGLTEPSKTSEHSDSSCDINIPTESNRLQLNHATYQNSYPSISSAGSMKTLKTELTPGIDGLHPHQIYVWFFCVVAIRSGVTLGSVVPNLECKPRTCFSEVYVSYSSSYPFVPHSPFEFIADRKPHVFKFVPNIHPSASTPGIHSKCSTPLSSERMEVSTPPSSNELVDMSSILAHSLSLRNTQAGSTRHFQDLNVRRASAPGGVAYSMRNKGNTCTMSIKAKVQQHLHNIRKKKKSDKKSMNVFELSWAEGPEGLPLYNPITLPYVASSKKENEIRDESPNENPSSVRRNSKRPTSRHIDECNRHSSSLFDAIPEDELETPLLKKGECVDSENSESITKAAILDLLSKYYTTLSLGYPPPSSSSTEPYSAINLEALPEGRLGTLKVHRSGKVTFVLGNCRFEVNQGSDCNFAQVRCGKNGALRN